MEAEQVAHVVGVDAAHPALGADAQRACTGRVSRQRIIDVCDLCRGRALRGA